MDVTIASCQMPYVHENLEYSLDLIINYARRADDLGAKLVCFPECYLQGYVIGPRTRELALNLSSHRFERILDQVSGIRPVLVIGLIEIESSRVFNTAIVLREGELIGTYRKVKLYGGEHGIFDPGHDFPIFETDGLKFGINICNDLNFPESTQAFTSQGIDLLVCPCNNMMGLENAEKWRFKHNEIRAIRASEAQSWLISSDVTGKWDDRISYGPTALINHEGVVVSQIPTSMPGLLVQKV